MDNHLTRKDYLILAAIGVVVVILILLMYQIDRQWLKLEAMEQTMQEQARDLRGLSGKLSRVGSGKLSSSLSESKDNSHIAPIFKRAAQATQQSNYSEGGWMVQAFGVNLKTITPLVAEDAYASAVQNYVLESLLARDPETLEWQGMLAKSWQVSEDGLTYTFQLRDDVVFSDGQPLTADDVVFSYDFIMNPAIRAPRERSYYSKIKRVTANNLYEVVFEFSESYFNTLSLAGGLAILPKHFYQPFLDKPNAFNQSKGLLLGSGPYRMENPESWRPDQGMVEVQRNQRYWGDVQPSLDSMVWRIIENDSARLTAFRNGEIDVYSARPREYKQLLDDPQLQKKAQHFEYMNPVGGYAYIGWNNTRTGKTTRFANPKVREAMTYLTDRQRIIEEIHLGYAEPAAGPFNPLGTQHDANIVPRPYNIEKAKSLLAVAGYADRDGDGVLENAQGEPFEFELVYFQGNEDTQRMVLLLRDMYARVGIILKPKPTEWSVMLDSLNKRDFDAITLSWTGSIEGDLYQIFHSSQIEDGGNNSIGYSSPELDAVIEQARATINESERMALWRKAEAILYRDQPYTFLLRGKSLVFVDKRLHNLQKTRLGLNLSTTPVELFIPEDLQGDAQ